MFIIQHDNKNIFILLYIMDLEMIGLYLNTLISVIGHKFSNILSILVLNKLTLPKELQNFVTNSEQNRTFISQLYTIHT